MADIGTTLRESRMRAHIDISEVEAATKIRAKYLRAIENEEWDLLPGTVYVKSFLRTYGDFLGLDSRLLIDEFKRRYERPLDHEVRQVASVRRERERSPRRRRQASFWRSPRVVIGASLIVIVVALFVIGSQSGSSPSTPGTPVGSKPSGSAGHHRHKPTGRGGTRTQSTSAGTTPTRSTTPVVAKKATLQLVATNAVWVCIVGPRDKTLIPGVVYQTGQKIEASATKLLVRLGNGSVTATVNGRPYVVKRSSSAIGLKITAAGAAPLASPPTCAT